MVEDSDRQGDDTERETTTQVSTSPSDGLTFKPPEGLLPRDVAWLYTVDRMQDVERQALGGLSNLAWGYQRELYALRVIKFALEELERRVAREQRRR
jgi:hypothetical protein